MQSKNIPVKIAVFITALFCTGGILYLAYIVMQWAFTYIDGLSRTGVASTSPILGVIILGVIVVLRFYFRWRANTIKSKKENKMN